MPKEEFDKRLAEWDDSKILVVSHSLTLEALFADGVLPDLPQAEGFIDSVQFENCKIRPMFIDDRGQLTKDFPF